MPDGTFAFPLAGRVSASGNTPREIADTITGRIKSNFRDSVPEVTVIVRDPAGMRFFVVGKVRTPGSYPISRSVNALQALSMAGGAADFADVSHAVLLRQGTKGQVVEPVDLGQMLKGGRALSPGYRRPSFPCLARVTCLSYRDLRVERLAVLTALALQTASQGTAQSTSAPLSRSTRRPRRRPIRCCEAVRIMEPSSPNCRSCPNIR
ncbi:polysaccharide biosynthesis/export family protein [Sphingomonas aurantiaca]|uniref:polysaccharide biosynthesis/export family protein n=1 Tax=Sphingomonas aurantiaca TaxID=185949 RepID=UPI002FE40759